MERKDKIEIFCGAIAILAAISEVFINGISFSSIAGAVKDVFGTLAIIILFFTIIWDKLPKIYFDFDKSFNDKMKPIIQKYNPILKKDETEKNRYMIDSNFANSICEEKLGTMRKFFDFNESSLTFSVKKELFMGKSTETFDEKQKRIISEIRLSLQNSDAFNGKIETQPLDDGFKVIIKEKQRNVDKQAELMVAVVDKIIILFLAINKKP